MINIIFLANFLFLLVDVIMLCLLANLEILGIFITKDIFFLLECIFQSLIICTSSLMITKKYPFISYTNLAIKFIFIPIDCWFFFNRLKPNGGLISKLVVMSYYFIWIILPLLWIKVIMKKQKIQDLDNKILDVKI